MSKALFRLSNIVFFCGAGEVRSPGCSGEKTFVAVLLRLPPWVPDFHVAVVVVSCPPAEMLVVLTTLTVMPPATPPTPSHMHGGWWEVEPPAHTPPPSLAPTA